MKKNNLVEKDICYQHQWFTYNGDACYLNNETISHNKQVIKEADTIEELCDVIVETKGATGDYKHYIYQGERYEKLKPKIIDDIRTQDFNVYAGIWTDKGLTYVAKMNDKGELELL